MAENLPLTARLKAVATALGITRHQQLPTPPDHRASELVWNGQLSARHAYIAGKLWESLDAEISTGGYCPQRKKLKTFDLITARKTLGAREQFVELAQQQFALQVPATTEPNKGKTKPLLANSARSFIPASFSAEWILFAPFCPGAEAKVNRLRELSCKCEDQNSITFSVKGHGALELRWFKWGAAVWTHRIPLELPNLTTLGVQRSKQYHEVLRGSHVVRSPTQKINGSIKVPAETQTQIGYALSLYSLNRPGWQQEHTPHALKIMSCPNILLELSQTQDYELDPRCVVNNESLLEKEMRLLCDGVHSPDLHEFAQPGLLHGYASWAGVSVHINEPMRLRLLASCTAFEQELQALWWRLHSISACLQTSDQITKHEPLLQTLKFAVQNALRIGPTEATPLRLFKEAVITTSRFKSVFEDFQQLCRNRNEF